MDEMFLPTSYFQAVDDSADGPKEEPTLIPDEDDRAMDDEEDDEEDYDFDEDDDDEEEDITEPDTTEP